MGPQEPPLENAAVIAQTLNGCRLFVGLTEAQRGQLARQSPQRRYAAGELLCREGERGKEVFVLVSGALEVFTCPPDGMEIVLARRDQHGQYAGEQALCDWADGWRTASVRAATAALVLPFAKEAVEEIIAHDTELQERLDVEYLRQIHQLRLVQKSIMYRALVAFDNQGGWSQEDYHADGEIVFRQGEPAERVYVILVGKALISHEQDGQTQTLAVLQEGQCFGEGGVMDRAPRRATVTAQGPLTTLSFSAAQFRQAVTRSPELYDYLAALRRVYALGRVGIAIQCDGTFQGHPALATLFRLRDGTMAVANHVVEHALYSGSLQLPPGTALEEYVYEDPGRHIRREIGLHDGRLARIFAQGPWDELGRVHRWLLDRSPIDREAAERFTRTGLLLTAGPEEIVGPEQILCFCLGVSRRTLERCLARGCGNLRDLADQTGASTVCGGCTAQIATLVGEVDGIAVHLAEIIPLQPTVRSFRFVPAPGADGEQRAPLRACLPGQHVVVAARIDGQWVCRSYTLTSPAGELAYREITVKREPHGHFSSWLFDRAGNGAELRLSYPQGTFWADLQLPDPLVCLVAGIGMTPALAIARSLAAAGTGVPLHIDYSARFERDFVYRKELETLAAVHPNIELTFRTTAAGDRIGDKDIEAYHARYLRARYYLCGPQAYQDAVTRGLAAAGVAKANIHCEVFTPAVHAPEKPAPPRRRANVVVRWLGLLLLAAYVAQAAFGLTWPAWAEWQGRHGVRQVSGGVLLTFLIVQWWLPCLRLAGNLRRSAALYSWHKYLGALAPLILYGHAPKLGYGFLFLLSTVYLGNAAVGLLDKTIVRDPKRRESYARRWLVLHIVLSLLLTGLALLHVLTILTY